MSSIQIVGREAKRHSPASIALAEGAAACARDARVGDSDVHIVHRLSHYKSFVIFYGIGDDPAPRYVLKYELLPEVPRGGWDPANEFAGLRFAMAMADEQAKIGVVEPVAFGLRPPWLVTKFQPGRSARELTDAAVGRRRAMEQGVWAAQRMADWLARFQTLQAPSSSRFDSDHVLGAVRGRLGEIVEAGYRLDSAAILTFAEHHIRASASDAAPLSRARVRHGDFGPQNIIVTPSGGITAIDFAGFGASIFDDDVIRFRLRMEDYAICGFHRRDRATVLWSEFLAAFLRHDPSPHRLALSYIHHLVSKVAWLLGETRRQEGRAPTRLTTRLREQLWLRDRLAWLRGLPADAGESLEHFRARL